MINIISGQTAVTSTPNNAPQKKDKASLTAQNNAAINTSAESTVSNDNSMQEDTAIFHAQTADKTSGNNPDNVDYQKERPVHEYVYPNHVSYIEDLRKEYVERNHYIDENTQISVLQIVNTETDHVIGQYPSDLYLNLLTKVRQSQKQLVNETI